MKNHLFVSRNLMKMTKLHQFFTNQNQINLIFLKLKKKTKEPT